MCTQERTDKIDTSICNRESKLRMMEWLEIITSGIYPSESQLEQMLDRIEGTP